MTQWAILSGITGNLNAYEAVLADVKRQRRSIDSLYILGDLIAPVPESKCLIERVQSPRAHELVPQVCQGWWEEQLLILHSLGRTGEPTELIERYGMPMVKTLWDSIPRDFVDWIRSLDFGFFELDCLLVHGSSANVSDEITPETSPIHVLDRLLRMDANTLFCGRSGLTFQYEIQQGAVTSSTVTLDRATPTQATVIKPRQVIGVGNVGRIPGQATYTIYSPLTNQVEFRTVRYGSSKGFPVSKSK